MYFCETIFIKTNEKRLGLQEREVKSICLTSQSVKFLFNAFSANVPLMDKPDSCFVIDLHRYLKCHASTDVFQTFCK